MYYIYCLIYITSTDSVNHLLIAVISAIYSGMKIMSYFLINLMVYLCCYFNLLDCFGDRQHLQYLSKSTYLDKIIRIQGIHLHWIQNEKIHLIFYICILMKLFDLASLYQKHLQGYQLILHIQLLVPIWSKLELKERNLIHKVICFFTNLHICNHKVCIFSNL